MVSLTDLLIDKLGLDIFSLLHKYTGRIIEEKLYKCEDYKNLSCNEKKNLKRIIKLKMTNEEKLYKENHIIYPLYPYRMIDILKITVDDIPYKIYNLNSAYHHISHNCSRQWSNSSIILNKVSKIYWYVNANTDPIEKKSISNELINWYKRRF